jgi:hypothetical protein
MIAARRMRLSGSLAAIIFLGFMIPVHNNEESLPNFIG